MTMVKRELNYSGVLSILAKVYNTVPTGWKDEGSGSDCYKS